MSHLLNFGAFFCLAWFGYAAGRQPVSRRRFLLESAAAAATIALAAWGLERLLF
jgi:hypothetical protein